MGAHSDSGGWARRRRLAVVVACAGVVTAVAVARPAHEPGAARHHRQPGDRPATNNDPPAPAPRRTGSSVAWADDLPAASPETTWPGAPSPAEERQAAALLLGHPALGRAVRERYAHAADGHEPTPTTLRVRTLIFRRHGCETHRCLQLFVWFPDGGMLDAGRIIADLSTGAIRVLKWG
ncbi:hypothetical protein [Sphaerisporangium fuscum]|uniref:hypothetical protein n=1 Tax=Sphaerisporangium fuscum TaxID=2835868 RepID=UPI001BDD2030|nr:hypothetical protein [Sphaerisporangium fuscum]